VPATSTVPAAAPARAATAPAARRRSPLWARLAVCLGTLLMLASGLTLVGGRLLVTTAGRQLNQQDLLGDTGAQARQRHVTIKGAKTVLLVGLDSRPGQNPTDLVRADTVMLLHVVASHDRGYLVSIPRDTYVQVPADRATGYGGGPEKINAAYAFGAWHGGGVAGGVRLLARTITALTGIVPDAAAVINFDGFRSVVGVLGGVDMCVDEKTTSIHIGHTADGTFKAPFRIHSDGTVGHAVAGVTPQVYEKGCRHFAAWQALDYVRQRDLLADRDYDYGRQRHQQQFIKAIFKQVFSAGTLTDLPKLNHVLSAMRGAMTIDSGGISPVDWLYAMRAVTPESLVTVKTNAGRFNPRTINGIAYEMLSPLSQQLLRAVRDDTLDQFVAAHPDWATAS
jgi:polyisoprenyl-teichoic acid--peptidoglycan teichoic acid transferase